jgi:ribosome maturation factor RimP
MSLGVQDPRIEVLSPGIDRMLRTDREWQVFRGKYIKYLMTGDSEWHSGQLLHLENGIVQIQQETVLKEIPFASIIKAKLDSTHEGENAHGI